VSAARSKCSLTTSKRVHTSAVHAQASPAALGQAHGHQRSLGSGMTRALAPNGEDNRRWIQRLQASRDKLRVEVAPLPALPLPTAVPSMDLHHAGKADGSRKAGLVGRQRRAVTAQTCAETWHRGKVARKWGKAREGSCPHLLNERAEDNGGASSDRELAVCGNSTRLAQERNMFVSLYMRQKISNWSHMHLVVNVCARAAVLKACSPPPSQTRDPSPDGCTTTQGRSVHTMKSVHENNTLPHASQHSCRCRDCKEGRTCCKATNGTILPVRCTPHCLHGRFNCSVHQGNPTKHKHGRAKGCNRLSHPNQRGLA
jgi:hypothetical protein